ncbi:YkgJ family cysteine cluster protein [Bacteroidota bacterium]
MQDNKGSDYGDIGSIFFQDGLRLGHQFTAEGINRRAIVQLMVSAYDALDGLIDSFRQRCKKEGFAVDCQKGCTWCCNQAVLASNHEILVIQQYIRESVPVNIVSEIKIRCAEKNEATREMTAMEFLHYVHPCPFLDHGSCLIYPVRPMACRCYLSSIENSCRDQHDHPDDKTKKAALYDFPLRAGRGINEGIRSALMENELLPSEWLLETFMAAVFEDEGILDSWLAGNTPFNIRTLSREENLYLREYQENQEDADLL